MTTNSRLKKQARDYAAQHGVAYAEARRILTEREPGQATAESGGLATTRIRVLTVQQAQRPDGRLPYPFHIDGDGFVGRQDFWRGKPLRLVGFVDDEDSVEVTVHREDFQADPDAALGKHPVLHDREGQFFTYTGVVEEVTAAEVDRSAPDAVTARVTTSDDAHDLTVGLGHLLEHLHEQDLRVLLDAGWAVTPGTAAAKIGDDLLGWLLSTGSGEPGTDDAMALVFEHLDTYGADPETPEEGGVTLDVLIDAEQAEVWLGLHHPGLVASPAAE